MHHLYRGAAKSSQAHHNTITTKLVSLNMAHLPIGGEKDFSMPSATLQPSRLDPGIPCLLKPAFGTLAPNGTSLVRTTLASPQPLAISETVPCTAPRIMLAHAGSRRQASIKIHAQK